MAALVESLMTPEPRVLWPGQPTLSLPSGMERYTVAGGAATVFPVYGGDTVRVIDVEGGQVAEIVGFVNGKADPGLFSQQASGDAEGLRSLLAQPLQTRLRERLARRRLDPADARSLELLGRDSRPGDRAEITAGADGVCVIVAPARDAMLLEGGFVPPTELTVFVDRADPARAAADKPQLPEPLADPVQDFRVSRATACAYEVKAGQWIQVIDVEGRQCSDFQAFGAAQLDQGIERCVDVTTTRSLMAQGYPRPGTHAKYYDIDFQPLVRVVQDSVMRHDAFGLACNRKYYEEMGYFGHVNCSDNFNGQLASYGIAGRAGWMSMNFFFNTSICDDNLLALDEPWSRPGDYVLLQAMTDLVCVTSACPDDIDAANGWNPTDIHVRVYDRALDAKKAIGFRPRPDSELQMTQETAFHTKTSELTRNFVEYRGYWLPACFANYEPTAEYWACRKKAVVMDLSPLRKFEVMGPDAEALLQLCLTRDVRRVAVGQVSYTAVCYPNGCLVDDGTVFRLSQNNFRWICGSDYTGEWIRKQAEERGYNVLVKSSTDQMHNLAVQGPNSRDILRQIIWTRPDQTQVEDLKFFRFTIGRLHHENGAPVLVSRTGYTGELGYEIFCHPNNAEEVWDEIWQAGAAYGLAPMGLDALDMVRIEAGLIFHGHEFCDQTDPYEAGIGFTVQMKNNDEDFIGREALVKRKENRQRGMVGLELAGDEVANLGDGVFIGRQQVGVVTSGMRSPMLARNIALCRITTEHAAVDTRVEVGKLDGLQKRLPAKVVKYPFYSNVMPEKKAAGKA